jgi:alpha-L-fucosidase
MIYKIKIMLIFVSLLLTVNIPTFVYAVESPDPYANETLTERDKRMKWFRDARFGMFIHWGVYSVPAGEWKGKPTTFFGEWIMHQEKIPVTEYEKLTAQFNPVKFNADEWVKVAKDAGMKYIVITSKHHDGFAMYGSAVSKFNIVESTPFKRDPLKELSVACQKAGIRLCFYYSHARDWHEPDGADNTWDFPVERNFQKYFEEKVKPQVRELLTNYGPISTMWFDTPMIITKEQCQELIALVHQLQPDCLVNGRVGFGLGDYEIPTDNQVETDNASQDWEACVTMNDTWGYRKDDNNWKPASTLIRQMVRVASRNGNYLLNVGPTAEGIIPQPSVDRLRTIGEWMKVNGESIYSSHASPFPYSQEWSMITTRPGKIFVHVFDWPGKQLKIYGIKSHITRAYLMADPTTSLKMSQKTDTKNDLYSVTLDVPAEAPDHYDSVVVLETDPNSNLEVFPGLTQQPDGITTMDPLLAQLHKIATGSTLSIDNRGYATGWINSDDWISWDFKMFSKGEYELQVVTAPGGGGRNVLPWQSGRKLAVELGGQKLEVTMNDDGKWLDPSNPTRSYVISKLGRIKINAIGSQQLVMRVISEQPSVSQTPPSGEVPGRRGPAGIVLVKVNLVPVE